MTKKVIRNFWC